MQRTRYISSFLLMCTFTLGGNILLASTPLPTETTVYQQQKQFTVTGIIKDKTGEPIPGANVVVKGTTTFAPGIGSPVQMWSSKGQPMES